MTEKPDYRTLVDELFEKIEKIMTAPVVDPESPPGFCRREYANAETLRRLDAVEDLFHKFAVDVAGDNEVARKRLEKHIAMSARPSPPTDGA